MKENQHLGLWNNKYVKRLKNNPAGQSKAKAQRVGKGRSCREKQRNEKEGCSNNFHRELSSLVQLEILHRGDFFSEQ